MTGIILVLDLNDMSKTSHSKADAELKISWSNSEVGNDVIYYVNEAEVGQGDAGFNIILSAVKENPELKVVITMTKVTSLGGDSLRNTLPFSARYDELVRASKKRITLKLL